LYGFSVNLIDSISVQVQEELTSIKDALDITLHANAGATSGLEPVLKQFASVVDAMGMLGMTRQRDLINEKKVFLQTQIAQGATLSDEDLMSMAAAILQIESSLSDFGGALNGSSSGFLPPAEYDKLLKLVANEIIVDIKKIKIWVTDFAADTTKIELLNEVPASLTQITGAMRILGHNSQAGLSHALNMYVSRDLILKRVQPSVISLDLLADAVTGLENFYQTLLEESVAPELGLEIAALSLTQLGHPPHAYIAKHENTAVPTLVKSA
jgi:chemosensory pili system protein ChpA (sensor histidine kinase/response regulator)